MHRTVTTLSVTADLGVLLGCRTAVCCYHDLPVEKVEDPGTLNLDNALILTYVVALITSPEDEEALGEHHRLIVRMLTDYKKALGLE